MKLLLIRHAESIGNQENRLQGHAEFSLSVVGKQQAQAVARSLSSAGQPNWIYTSPLKRAVETADILVNALPLQVRETITIKSVEALKELNNGVFRGLTWAEAQTQYPDLCQALENSPEWVPIPGAESLQEVRDRAEQFIQNVLTQHQDHDKIWIVTHGGFIQFLVAAILGSDRVWGLDIQPTALFEFWIDLARWQLRDQNLYNSALWQIRCFNETQHLQI